MLTFQFSARSRGSRTKYDWDELLDGNTWEVSYEEAHPREDEQNRTTITRFRRTAHAAAKARDLKLQTEIIDDTHLVIKAWPVE